MGEYLHRYALAGQWCFAVGYVDGPATLVFDRHDSGERPAYFVTLHVENDRIVAIRDFLFARYTFECEEMLFLR